METEQNLVIRGENIQRIYDYYINKKFLVNRRYQRKLVWSIEEKQKFIDSIRQGFSVPIILIAEVGQNGEKLFEIIDGMQRLNAIVSFIEGEFTLDDRFFDLNTLVESKDLLDKGLLVQNIPILSRDTCKKIANYTLPLSVYSFEGENKIDEIFRRINSNGRHLSRQELRQAGVTGEFAQLVRQLASKVRGDSSHSHKLHLDAMKNISITNKKLTYGINVDTIFWVTHGIITRENVRDSTDEGIVADILAYMALTTKPASGNDILDEFYGFGQKDRFQNIETAVKKIGTDILEKQFLYVYEEVRKILNSADITFNKLFFKKPNPSISRYFQVLFLALHELLVQRGLDIPTSKYPNIAAHLEHAGNKHIQVSRGGTWTGKNRRDNVNVVVGLIQDEFSKRSDSDVALDSWITELENLLMQSFTEQSLYDFKIGFHRLDSQGTFDENLLHKLFKTLTAMANHGPNNVGYIIIGVVDRKAHADRHEAVYGTKSTIYNQFYITGVQNEARNHHGDLDTYFQKITQYIKSEPIPQPLKDQLSRDIRLVNYFDKSVLVFRVKSGQEPFMYDGKLYERHGPNLNEVKPDQYGNVYRRFFTA